MFHKLSTSDTADGSLLEEKEGGEKVFGGGVVDSWETIYEVGVYEVVVVC